MSANPKPAAQENLNPYEFALRQFDRAADHLGLDPGTRDVLRTPKRQLTVSIPVKMDDGRIKVSLKSKGTVKVNGVAQQFGGGGHDFAAGFSADGKLDDVRRKLIERLTK